MKHGLDLQMQVNNKEGRLTHWNSTLNNLLMFSLYFVSRKWVLYQLSWQMLSAWLFSVGT